MASGSVKPSVLFCPPNNIHDALVHATALDLSDRKSTRLNSSHLGISYAVFCLKKKRYSLMTGNANSPAFLYTGTPGSGGAMHDRGTIVRAQRYGYAINIAEHATRAHIVAAGTL